MYTVLNEPLAFGMGSETLGGRIRRLRATKGLTQEDLAHAAGVRVQAISLIESGKRKRPQAATVAGIADVLDVSPAYLEYGVESSSGRSWPDVAVVLRSSTHLSEEDIDAVVKVVQALERRQIEEVRDLEDGKGRVETGGGDTG